MRDTLGFTLKMRPCGPCRRITPFADGRCTICDRRPGFVARVRLRMSDTSEKMLSLSENRRG